MYVSVSVSLCQALISAGAPVDIKDSQNERPIQILSQVMTHKMFTDAISESCGGRMVTSAFEFVLSTIDTDKEKMVEEDIIQFTRQCYVRSNNTSSEVGEGDNDDDDDDDDGLSDDDDDDGDDLSDDDTPTSFGSSTIIEAPARQLPSNYDTSKLVPLRNHRYPVSV